MDYDPLPAVFDPEDALKPDAFLFAGGISGAEGGKPN